MIDPESPELRRAVFGRQVELFLESEIGEYLRQCAQAEIDNAVRALSEVDAEDPKAVRQIQTKLKVAESVMGWLGDAITQGQQARQMLEATE